MTTDTRVRCCMCRKRFTPVDRTETVRYLEYLSPKLRKTCAACASAFDADVLKEVIRRIIPGGAA